MYTSRHGMQFIKMIERERKPREKELHVRGFLEGSGDYVDYAKFFHMTTWIVPEELTRRKLELYRANRVKPFAGGIYLELAYCQEQVDGTLTYIKDPCVLGNRVFRQLLREYEEFKQRQERKARVGSGR